MCFKTSKLFIFINIVYIKGHLKSDSWSEKEQFCDFLKNDMAKKFIYTASNFHFYFPAFLWCKSMMFGLSNALSTMWIGLKLIEIEYFDSLSSKFIFQPIYYISLISCEKWVLEIEDQNYLSQSISIQFTWMIMR